MKRLLDAAADLEACGWLANISQPREQVLAVWPLTDWDTLATECSKRLGGQWWPSSSGVTWANGSHRKYLLDRTRFDEVVEARDICEYLGADAPGWSFGSVARSLLAWVGQPEPSLPSDELLMEGASRNYHDCEPCWHSHAALLDVSGCYFQLFQRLPSLRLVQLGGRIHDQGHASAEEAERLAALIAAVRSNKIVRNSLVGCMTGSEERQRFHAGGVCKYLRMKAGPFRAAGLLIVRSGWELCREASEEVGSVYSVVDCVVSPGAVVPPIWKKLGLAFRLVAEGDAHICNAGSRRVGENATEFYKKGDRTPLEIERPPRPAVEYWRQWLG